MVSVLLMLIASILAQQYDPVLNGYSPIDTLRESPINNRKNTELNLLKSGDVESRHVYQAASAQ